MGVVRSFSTPRPTLSQGRGGGGDGEGVLAALGGECQGDHPTRAVRLACRLSAAAPSVTILPSQRVAASSGSASSGACSECACTRARAQLRGAGGLRGAAVRLPAV